MNVSAVDRHVFEIAFASNLTDFEDAVQLACALSDNLEAIVTRCRRFRRRDLTNSIT